MLDTEHPVRPEEASLPAPYSVLVIGSRKPDAAPVSEPPLEAIEGFELVSCDGLPLALELLEHRSPDLILLDVSASDASPLERLTRVHLAASEVPIVLLGTAEQEDLLLRATHHGARDYLLLEHLHPTFVRRTLLYAIERERTERARRRSDERYRSLFEGSLDPILITSADGEILDANPAFEEFSGYGRAELHALPVQQLYANPNDRQLFRRELEGKGKVRDFPGRIRRKSGEVRDCVLTATARPGLQGAALTFQTFVRDLTGRKRLEQELADALQRERAARASAEDASDQATTVLESISDAFFALDADWRFTYVNEAARRFTRQRTRIDPDCLLGRVFWEAVPEVLGTRFETENRRVMQERAPAHFEEYLEAWGVWFEVSTYPSQDGVAVYFRDVSERKRADEALRQSEARFRAVFDGAAFGMAVMDPAGCLLEVNAAVERKFGRPAERMRNITLDSITHPDDRETGRVLRRSLLSGERAHYVVEQRLWHQAGHYLWVRMGVSLVRDATGAPEFLIAVGLDITRHRQSEERFRALVENISDAITLLDFDGNVRYVSPAFERITGFTTSERVGKSAFDRLHPDDVEAARREYRNLRMEPGSLVRIEPRIQHKNGDWRTVELIGRNLLHHAAVQGVVVVYRDITEQRQLEEQFRQAQKMEAVGRLAGGVAHDFNNLLHIITGNLTLALMQVDEETAVREDLEEARRAAQRAAELTHQLLAFSRRQVLQPRVLDPAEEVQRTATMLRRVIGEDVELVSILRSTGRVEADPGQMCQVLMNLAVNARDAMPLGGTLTIETRDLELTDAEVRSFPYRVAVGSYVQISLRDTGCGMDAETLSRAFEPFFTTKKAGEGSGLGLSTVYGIVKQSNGYVWVDSAPDEGTTFRICLPRAVAEAQDDGPHESTPPHSHGETILVVEDESGVRKVTRRVLERLGYRVVEAGSAAEALQLADELQDRIDLVLADVVMPGASGADLARQLAHRHPEVRVIYMSGYTDDQVVRHGIREARSMFIQKPFEPDQLARKVREALDGR